MTDKIHSATEIIKEWRDYEEIVTYSKKNFDAAVKKTKPRKPSN